MEKAQENKRPPPGRWRVRWYDPTGKAKTKTFQKKPQAQNHKTKIEGDLVRGTYRDPSAGKTLLRDVAEKWFSALSHVKRSTRASYRTMLDTHILPCWGEVPVSAIDYEDVDVWVAELQMPRGDGVATSDRRASARCTRCSTWCCSGAYLDASPSIRPKT